MLNYNSEHLLELCTLNNLRINKILPSPMDTNTSTPKKSPGDSSELLITLQQTGDLNRKI